MQSKLVLCVLIIFLSYPVFAVQRMGVYGSTGVIQPNSYGTLFSRCLDEHEFAPTTSTNYTKILSNDPTDIVVRIDNEQPIPLEQAIREGMVSITGFTRPGGYSSGVNRVAWDIDRVRVNNLTDKQITVEAKRFTPIGTTSHSPLGYDASQLSGLSQSELWNSQQRLEADQQSLEAEQRLEAERSWSSMIIEEEEIQKLHDDMILVQGGSFSMGRTTGTGSSDELPTHRISLNSFYMNRYEVSQSLWYAVMGNCPSATINNRLPVDSVSWFAVMVFCNKLSIMDGLTPVYRIHPYTNTSEWGASPTSYNETWNRIGCNWSANGYRLPTEAEWEYAARGGTNTPDYLYSGSDDLNAVAWFDGNDFKGDFPSGSKPSGLKAPNALGLYDMSGNLSEWCWDWFDDSYYRSRDGNNWKGPVFGLFRVLRGGHFLASADLCRITNRNCSSPFLSGKRVGFRVCRAGL